MTPPAAADELSLDPARSILLVMDYQPGILARLSDAGAQLARGRAAIDVARAAGAHVGFVRVAFADEDFDAVPPHSMFAAYASDAARETFHADAPGTQIHEAIAPLDGDVVVRKSRVGAFSTTDLAKQLAARGVDTLILAGISTSGVVLSTVRDAVDHDYRVVVLSDASADPDPEIHAFLLERIFPRQATITTTAALAQAFAR